MATDTSIPEIPVNDKRTIFGWAMFDWANSSYALVISVAVFPLYFNSVMGDSELFNFLGIPVTKTSLFSYSLSIAYLVIAVSLPMLTGIADYSGRRKTFMKFFTFMGALACMAMFLFDGRGTMYLGVFSFVFAVIGFEGGKTFYNSYLPLIASEDKYDDISAKGFTYGYIGSMILLILNLVMIQKYELFGFADSGWATRTVFITVGIWWLAFANFSFVRLPKDYKVNNIEGLLSKGFSEIKQVWNYVMEQHDIKFFLFSFFFYIAGVLTIIGLASTFAIDQLGFEASELIILILLLQFLGIVGAILFAKMSDWKGNKISIITMLFIWMGVCVAAYYVQEKMHFYVIAGFVGLVMGGIQSLSRSTYSKLIPEDAHNTASYFSFFDVTEKVAMVMGSLSFGIIDQLTGGMRNSIFALIFFFALGIIFILFVTIRRKEVLIQTT